MLDSRYLNIAIKKPNARLYKPIIANKNRIKCNNNTSCHIYHNLVIVPFSHHFLYFFARKINEQFNLKIVLNAVETN